MFRKLWRWSDFCRLRSLLLMWISSCQLVPLRAWRGVESTRPFDQERRSRLATAVSEQSGAYQARSPPVHLHTVERRTSGNLLCFSHVRLLARLEASCSNLSFRPFTLVIDI